MLFFFLLNHFDIVKASLANVVKILSPFIVGCSLAFILNPVLKYFEAAYKLILEKKKERPKLKRALALLSAVLIFVLGIGALLLGIIPQTLSSIESLVPIVYRWALRLIDLLATVLAESHLETFLGPDQIQQVKDALNQATMRIYELAQRLIPQLITLVFSIATSFWNFVIGLIIAIYILAGKEKFKGQFRKAVVSVLSERAAGRLIRFVTLANKIFSRYILGQLTDALLVGIICFIFTFFVFKAEFAVLIAVVVAVTNIIPYFGPFMGGFFGGMILLIQNPLKALFFGVFILILQQVDGNIISPRILGESTGLNGIWIIFAVTVGGGIFGMPGMILGVPVFAVVYSVVCVLLNKRLKSKGLSDDIKQYLNEDQAKFL